MFFSSWLYCVCTSLAAFAVLQREAAITEPHSNNRDVRINHFCAICCCSAFFLPKFFSCSEQLLAVSQATCLQSRAAYSQQQTCWLMADCELETCNTEQMRCEPDTCSCKVMKSENENKWLSILKEIIRETEVLIWINLSSLCCSMGIWE